MGNMDNIQSVNDLRDLITNIGISNNWKGYAGLYFTQKQMRQIKKITGVNCQDMTIKELKNILENK